MLVYIILMPVYSAALQNLTAGLEGIALASQSFYSRSDPDRTEPEPPERLEPLELCDDCDRGRSGVSFWNTKSWHLRLGYPDPLHSLQGATNRVIPRLRRRTVMKNAILGERKSFSRFETLTGGIYSGERRNR